jgi:transposase-like protein
VSIGDRRYYLWRAVDQDHDIIDVSLQKPRNGLATKRCLRKLMKSPQAAPNGFVTDKFVSYRVARRELTTAVRYKTNQYADSLWEASHRATRKQEPQMKRFQTVSTAQRILRSSGPCSQSHQRGPTRNERGNLSVFPVQLRPMHGRRPKNGVLTWVSPPQFASADVE